MIDLDYYTEKQSGRPVIRMYGINEEGNSVCAHVHNFVAYFYVELTNTANIECFDKDVL